MTSRRKALEFFCFLFVLVASKAAFEPFQLPDHLPACSLNSSFPPCPSKLPSSLVPTGLSCKIHSSSSAPLGELAWLYSSIVWLLSWVGLSSLQALASSLWGFHTNVGKLCVCRRMHSLFLRKSGIHGLWSRGPSPPAVSRHLHLSFPCLVFRCLPTSFCPLPYSFCFPTTINLRASQNKARGKPSPPQNHSCSSSLRRDALVEAPSCFPNYLP